MDRENKSRVTCRTPTQGRTGTTSIPKWKYDCVRQAIIDTLDESAPTAFPFKDLANAVKARLSPEDISELGSIGWHVTTVKLNMEVKGEISRISGTSPQMLVKTKL